MKARTIASLVAAVAFAATPAGALAEPTIIGQNAPMLPMAYCQKSPGEFLESSTAGGNDFAAPIAGTITSWTTTASSAPGQQVSMKVYRPVLGAVQEIPGVPVPPGTIDMYTVIAHDGPRTLRPSSFNTFETDIPVQAGDIVGYYEANSSANTPNACFYNNLVASDYMAVSETSTSDGSSVFLPTLARAARPNVSAVLQPPPTLASLSPSSGLVTGGTTVAIAGTDLENATGVSFGGAPAAGFKIVSEEEIVATTPAGAGPVPVTVTVTTVAGSATGGKFTYESSKGTVKKPGDKRNPSGFCIVPKLTGAKLGAARRKLHKSRCRLGKVRGPHRKSARIEAQHPAKGKIRATGTPVNITLG
jgi:hypothetical protein